ncbi:YraN family protein [Paenibacillus yanchengensis]|uniref:UPF0102 protein ACFSJH_14050 n=1 Tax=Paenibacillus yanchengensis TaxID=2035833 RepID=A0ABW4YMH9_9BACL
MSDDRKKVGSLGEQMAKQRLIEQGYSILDENWRCKRGEIDIVATFADQIIIVEVRTRRRETSFGTALESVDYRKQKRLQSLAQYYVAVKGLSQKNIRFDVIAITMNSNYQLMKFQHIEAAF